MKKQKNLNMLPDLCLTKTVQGQIFFLVLVCFILFYFILFFNSTVTETEEQNSLPQVSELMVRVLSSNPNFLHMQTQWFS